MSTSQLRADAEALRAAAARFGQRLAAEAATVPADELFEVTRDLQAVANAVEGAQLVAIAHAGAHETRLTERGPVQVHHELGFIDAMTSSEVSLATGVGQWAAGRKVGLAAALSARFPRLLAKVVAGEVATANAGKVTAACDGLDEAACAAVDAVMADRVVGMDPARITTVARRVATRLAADQVAAATTKNRTDRCVQVSPGPDGTTDWWARLPAATSAAAWAAVSDLADRYARKDPALSTDQARADAFADLLLTNVTVTAKVTLGIPVLTGPDAQTARATAIAEHTAETGAGPATSNEDATNAAPAGPVSEGDSDTRSPTGSEGAGPSATTGGGGTAPTCTPVPVTDPAWVRPAYATGGRGLGPDFSLSAALISGCDIPGIGYIDADTIEALLTMVPTDIGRALLDARTGTLLESVSTAYRPPKTLTDFVTTRDGTCRMWGCTRPATHCDLDHARPWPAGPTTPTNLAGLCRRHHRLKQRRRWTYHLTPDGTATWTSPTGTQRITHPHHATLPPPTPPPPELATTPAPELVDAGPPPF